MEMGGDNGQSGFRRGVMSLVILGLLKKEDMYGYQLVQESEKKSGGRIVTQEGSLYPVLYKLVDQGLISDRRVQVGKRMTRVYYHLEPAGEARLKELLREYAAISRGIYEIVREDETNGVENSGLMVSVENLQRAAGEQEAEKANLRGNPELRPGLC